MTNKKRPAGYLTTQERNEVGPTLSIGETITVVCALRGEGTPEANTLADTLKASIDEAARSAANADAKRDGYYSEPTLAQQAN